MAMTAPSVINTLDKTALEIVKISTSITLDLFPLTSISTNVKSRPYPRGESTRLEIQCIITLNWIE